MVVYILAMGKVVSWYSVLLLHFLRRVCCPLCILLHPGASAFVNLFVFLRKSGSSSLGFLQQNRFAYRVFAYFLQ